MKTLILIAAALLPASSAWAGQRAVYLADDGKKLTIEVTDEGQAVVRPEGEEQYGVLREGHFYLVAKEQGVWHVARMEDMAAAFDKVMPPIFKDIFNMAAKGQAKSRLRIEAVGSKTVAGQQGQLFRIYGLNDENPSAPVEMVLTKEAAMQPAGKAMEQFSISSVLMMAPLLGDVAASMVSDMQAIFTHGTPLDMGTFKLQSIQTVPIAASVAALPAAPDSVDEIVKSVKTTAPATTE